MSGGTCYHCFEALETGGPCPRCGYDPAEDHFAYSDGLAHGAILNGRYILGRILDIGESGITYIAQDVSAEQRVVVKEYFPRRIALRKDGHEVVSLPDQQDAFQEGRKLFLAEAQTLAQFHGSEHVIPLHSYFEENGTAYLSMAYVEGTPLLDYLHEKAGTQGGREVRDLFVPVMRLLSDLHQKGEYHKDLSPESLYIASDGRMKLLNLGGVRKFAREAVLWSEEFRLTNYMALEEFSRRQKGSYTNVYNMAAMFCHALTGHRLPQAVDRMCEEEPLFSPERGGDRIPRKVQPVLEKALALQSGDRYQTMEEFLNALEGC